MKDEFKLYVVGELSGDPDEWDAYGNRKLVMATSPAEALDLAGGCCHLDMVAEVEVTGPTVLMRE